MNILQVNKYFYRGGGSAGVFFAVSRLLEKKGHRISFFSVTDPRNDPSPFSGYFTEDVSFKNFRLSRLLKFIGRLTYSTECNRKVGRLLDMNKTDLVHLHNIYHQIAPSILLEMKKRRLPVVATVHNYHLIAPNHLLFHDNRICEATHRHKYYEAVLDRCIKNSYLASFIEAAEKYLRYLLPWEISLTDIFIAPSKFLQKKLLSYGIPAEKVEYLANFVDTAAYSPDYSAGGNILYFGRLAPEKGLSQLLQVMSRLPEIRLDIVGGGSCEKQLIAEANRLNLSNVSFLGFKEGSQLKEILKKSRFTVLPSLWYEIAPLSVLESFASGKPVIATETGGIPEMVRNGENGLLVEPNNIPEMEKAVRKLWHDRELTGKLGYQARADAVKNYDSDNHYRRLMAIYKKAEDRAKK